MPLEMTRYGSSAKSLRILFRFDIEERADVSHSFKKSAAHMKIMWTSSNRKNSALSSLTPNVQRWFKMSNIRMNCWLSVLPQIPADGNKMSWKNDISLTATGSPAHFLKSSHVCEVPHCRLQGDSRGGGEPRQEEQQDVWHWQAVWSGGQQGRGTAGRPWSVPAPQHEETLWLPVWAWHLLPSLQPPQWTPAPGPNCALTLTDQSYGKTALMKALLHLKDGKNETVERLIDISEKTGDIGEFVNAAYSSAYYKGATCVKQRVWKNALLPFWAVLAFYFSLPQVRLLSTSPSRGGASAMWSCWSAKGQTSTPKPAGPSSSLTMAQTFILVSLRPCSEATAFQLDSVTPHWKASHVLPRVISCSITCLAKWPDQHSIRSQCTLLQSAVRWMLVHRSI